jgi:hypothetical protein
MNFKKKFRENIQKYINGDNWRHYAKQRAITNCLNKHSELIGPGAARAEAWEVLEEFHESLDLDWLFKRLTPGSLYEEGDRVMGWLDVETQFQAEHLPLKAGYIYEEVADTYFTVYEVVSPGNTWNQRGFYEAENLPIYRVTNYFPFHWEVNFPVSQTKKFLAHGYALPCQLQWRRDINEGYLVTRSIREHGFWTAWKWWDGALYWYIEHRPELVGDLDLWQVHRYEPPANPYAAVLGGRKE